MGNIYVCVCVLSLFSHGYFLLFLIIINIFYSTTGHRVGGRSISIEEASG